MEAEYIMLFHSMRELIPVRWLIEELATALDVDRHSLSTISTAWEDNKEILALANAPMLRMTPCSKQIGIKYNWFRSWIDGVTACIKSILSALQKADILTKLSGKNEFPSKRKMLLGW
eukprot:15366495-Ditylum_brightwellii.AAC.1